MTSRLITAVVCTLILVGCSTVDPITMERTPRDEETYVAPQTDPTQMGRKKVYVVSKVIEHQRARETNHIAFLSKAVESSVAQYFSNLGWFRTVDREHGLSVDASAVLADMQGGGKAWESLPDADFVLFVETSVAFIAKQGWKMTSHSKKARGVQVESDFRLVDIHSREMIVGMRFRATAECGKGTCARRFRMPQT